MCIFMITETTDQTDCFTVPFINLQSLVVLVTCDGDYIITNQPLFWSTTI